MCIEAKHAAVRARGVPLGWVEEQVFRSKEWAWLARGLQASSFVVGKRA